VVFSDVCLIVPRHPSRGIYSEIGGVALLGNQVLERSDVIELGGSCRAPVYAARRQQAHQVAGFGGNAQLRIMRSGLMPG